MAWKNHGLYGNQTLTNALEDLEEYLEELEGIVGDLCPKSRIIYAGAGLSGTGDLSADLTLNIGAGSGIDVQADSVWVDYPTLDLRYSLVSHNHSGVYEPVDASILRSADVDSTPLSGEWLIPVSTGWAYAHQTAADPHSVYVLHTEVHDTPVNGSTQNPISSNWAYDHDAAADPHPQYLLEADIDDTPVNGVTSAPISSNWAYDHAAATTDVHAGADYAQTDAAETITAGWVFSAYPRVAGLYVGPDTDLLIYEGGSGNELAFRFGSSGSPYYAKFSASSGQGLYLANTKVVGTQIGGWGTITGSSSRSAFTIHTAQTISNPPTQTQVQNIDNSLVSLSQRFKALVDDLKTHGLISS